MRHLFRLVFLVLCFGFTYSTAASGAPLDIDEVITLGPPYRVDFELTDPSGFVAITVTRSENADTVVPPLVFGETELTLWSTKIDQTRPLVVEFIVTPGVGDQVVHSFSDAATVPVPEPSSLVLLATAGGLALRRRYRSYRTPNVDV